MLRLRILTAHPPRPPPRSLIQALNGRVIRAAMVVVSRAP
jgi:hypothetical protein